MTQNGAVTSLLPTLGWLGAPSAGVTQSATGTRVLRDQGSKHRTNIQETLSIRHTEGRGTPCCTRSNLSLRGLSVAASRPGWCSAPQVGLDQPRPSVALPVEQGKSGASWAGSAAVTLHLLICLNTSTGSQHSPPPTIQGRTAWT